MPYSRTTFPDLYLAMLANLKAVGDDTYDRVPKVFRQFYYHYGPDQIKGSTINFTSQSGLGLFSTVAELADIPFDTPVQGYDKLVTPLKYGLRVRISDKSFDDDQLGKTRGFFEQLAISAAEDQESKLAGLFNNGFTTTETSADGLAIFSGVHTTPKAGTYLNTPATAADLSMSSLEQATIDTGNLIDDSGKRMQMKFKWLVVPTEFEWLGKRLLGSEGLPQTANRDINPAFQILTLVKSEYLTDLDAFFMVANPFPTGAILAEKKSLSLETQRTIIAQYTDTAQSYRWLPSMIDPRGWYGNPGA